MYKAMLEKLDKFIAFEESKVQECRLTVILNYPVQNIDYNIISSLRLQLSNCLKPKYEEYFGQEMITDLSKFIMFITNCNNSIEKHPIGKILIIDTKRANTLFEYNFGEEPNIACVPQLDKTIISPYQNKGLVHIPNNFIRKCGEVFFNIIAVSKEQEQEFYNMWNKMGKTTYPVFGNFPNIETLDYVELLSLCRSKVGEDINKNIFNLVFFKIQQYLNMILKDIGVNGSYHFCQRVHIEHTVNVDIATEYGVSIKYENVKVLIPVA